MKTIRYIFVLPILVIASNVYGQDATYNNSAQSKLQLGVSYSSDINLSAEEIAFSQNTGYKTNYNQYNFTIGLNAQYFIIENFALQSGLSYSSRQFEGTFYCYVCDVIGDPFKPQKISLQFLQVPIAVKYYPYNSKIGFFGKLGVLNQFMIGKPDIERLEENTYLLSALLGAGVKYRLNYGFTTQLSVRYTNSLSDTFKNADYSYNMLGMQLSLLKHF